MKRPILVLSVLFGVIIALSIAQVIVANRISTTGTLLGKVDRNLQKLEEENTKFSEKLLLESSLYQIASSAAMLGFVETKSQIFISRPVPLAIVR